MLDFTRTESPQCHQARSREIIKAHPQVRDLVGPHFLTPIAIVLTVAGQLALAFAVHDLGIGWVLLLAYLVGAVLAHALYALIHECSHNLALRSASANKLLGIVCDLPLAIPSATAFRTYHLLHHRHLGDEVMDPDIVSRFEARLVGASAWRKALWLVLFPLSQGLRPLKVPGVRAPAGWLLLNLAVVLTVDAVVFWWLGFGSLLYLTASTLFALGLHPLGGRWIQEHYVTRPGQETYSYYGIGNLVSFNIGYHNEHHDFMTVPWPHLPSIRRLAPEYYAPLAHYRSWTRVVLRFILDPRLSAYSRIVHVAPAGSPATANLPAPD